MTHVPGPWKIIATDDIAWSYVTAQDHITVDEQKDLGILAGGIIAEVFYRIDDFTFADVEANANLIHAAPDLLEACINLMDFYHGKGSYKDIHTGTQDDAMFDAWHTIHMQVEAAISKARGEA